MTLQDWFDHPWYKVTAPDKAVGDQFGASVSHPDILAVGAWFSDPDGVSMAGYYLHQQNNGTATYLTKVTAPDKAVGDRLDSPSRSRNILAVGASADPDGVTDAEPPICIN